MKSDPIIVPSAQQHEEMRQRAERAEAENRRMAERHASWELEFEDDLKAERALADQLAEALASRGDERLSADYERDDEDGVWWITVPLEEWDRLQALAAAEALADQNRAMSLCCAVCLYAREGQAEEAVTVIEGYAVCDDHLGHVAQGQRFVAIMRTAKEQRD